MALIKKSISSISGLELALSNLAAADSSEQSRAQAAEATLQTNIDTEATTRGSADTTLTNNLASEVSRAQGAEADLQAAINTEVTDRTTAVTAEHDRAVAAEAALGVRIDNVLSNTDGNALDSLVEVVTAFQNADSNLNNAITSLANTASTNLTAEVNRATAAEADLQTAITTEATTRGTAVTTLQGNIDAEATARAAADTALETSLKAYSDNAARLGGSVSALEVLTVANNKVVLTNKPKDGVGSIMNFARVSYVDVVTNNEFLYPVSLDSSDASGKTFIVAVDTSGELNGKSVFVQYSYVAA